MCVRERELGAIENECFFRKLIKHFIHLLLCYDDNFGFNLQAFWSLCVDFIDIEDKILTNKRCKNANWFSYFFPFSNLKVILV